MNSKVRCWCFTKYNYDRTEFDELIKSKTDDIKYCVYQEETCPTTQKNHIQGYVVFKNVRRLTEVKKWMNDKTLHLECAKGTPTENRIYCTKEDSRLENTEPIELGNIILCGERKRTDIHAVRDKILHEGVKKTDILMENPKILARYPKFVDYCIEVANEPAEKTREPPNVIYIHGKPGVGKTRKAIEMTGDDDYYELTDSEKAWFCGYNYEKIVIIDDFTGKLPRNTLLKLLDRYPKAKRFEVKGGHVYCDPDMIIITSNYEIDDLEYDYTTKTALKRRVTQTVKL